MSMNNSSCVGYTVKASDLTKVLPKHIRVNYKENLGSSSEVEELLAKYLPASFPPISSVFSLNDEDESTDLEKDIVYVMFDECDLYIRKETPEMKAMKALSVTPVESRWVSWG